METNAEVATQAPSATKLVAWANQVRISAIPAAITSLLAGLGLFKFGQLYSEYAYHPATFGAADALWTIGALISLVAMLMASTWATVATIGFQFRALQFAVAKGMVLRAKPGMYIAYWFIPIANLIMPLFGFRDMVRFASAAQTKRQRLTLITSAWVVLFVVHVASSIGGQISNPSNPTVPEVIAAIGLFAGVTALQSVPYILFRNFAAELTGDLLANPTATD